jgi:hypothetical protein
VRAAVFVLAGVTVLVTGVAQQLPSYTRHDIQTQIATSTVALADLNGDKRPDLVFISPNGGSSYVSTMLGRGDGTFQPAQNVATGVQNLVLAVGDLNGDGRADVVTIDAVNNQLYILISNGNGLFQTPRIINNVSGNSIVIGDFNGDRIADLAILPFNGPVNIYLGKGNGDFFPPIQTATGGAGAAIIAAADFDGDGNLDVATIQQVTNNVAILLGHGDGTFATPVTYPLDVTSTLAGIAVADVNGDGALDLVITEPAQRKIAVALGNGDGTFAPFKSFPIQEPAYGLVVTDVNGDGKPDIVAAANQNTASTSFAVVLLGNLDGTFGPPRNFPVLSGATTIAVANLDGDSKPDIVVSGVGADAITTLLSFSAVAGPPHLHLTETHNGLFIQGQLAVTFTVIVDNNGGTATNAPVSIRDLPPASLSNIVLFGEGWNCANLACSRSDPLNPGIAYPPIIITANVAPDASPQQGNVVAALGGGSPIVETIDNFYVNATGCQFSIDQVAITPTSAGVAAGTVNVSASPGCAWIATSNVQWLHVVDPGTGIGSASFNYIVDQNPTNTPRSGIISVANSTFTVNQSFQGPCGFTIGIPGQAFFNSDGGTDRFTLHASNIACPWRLNTEQPWISFQSPISGIGTTEVDFTIAPNFDTAPRTGAILAGGLSYGITQSGRGGPRGLHYVPATPCRILDTRNPNGPFGGPQMGANTSRAFDVQGSPCGIPSNALAYAVNVSVVPLVGLGSLTIWPTGQPQPGEFTLSSPDGRVKSNASIVPAGDTGQVSINVSDAANVIVDISGYFISDSGNTALAFYALAPCRIVDTRTGAGLAPNLARDFLLLSSPCGIPSTAQAYALNMTAVPTQGLGYLVAWPTGSPQPGVATLTDPVGTITANTAIVGAGSGGAITVLATDSTHLLIDINGYFAPPGAPGALGYFPVSACRMLDTRDSSGPFGGPTLLAGETRVLPVQNSACSIPSISAAYSMNATVVPPASLNSLQLWSTGAPPPGLSTLYSSDGAIVSNGAIVLAGTNGMITVSPSNVTDLILDITGYFAP